MKAKAAVRSKLERITLLGVEGKTLKLLQADQKAEQLHLRHVAVRHLQDKTGADLQESLQQMVQTLDKPWGRCVLIVPRNEVFVRYATLPSHQPSELLSLATYQLHGELPFPVEEFVLACQPLARDDAGTRVFITAIHRPVIDGLVRLSKSAGLTPDAVVVSTEGVALWAGRLWDKMNQTPPQSWCFAAATGESVELGIVVGDQLVSMRRVAWAGLDVTRLSALIQETVLAYSREPKGLPPQSVLVMGAFANPRDDEQLLEQQLGFPVNLVDPASTQFWDEPMTQATLELLHEVEMTDLLGVATRPRQIAFNLLPTEIRRQQQQAEIQAVLRNVYIWAGAGLLACVSLAAAVVAHERLQLRALERRVAESEPQARAVQTRFRLLGSGLQVQRHTQQMLQLLQDVTSGLPAGMTISIASLEPSGRLQIKGTAPSYDILFTTTSALSSRSGIRNVRLKSASERTPGQVEYELSVEGVVP
ncbi:MAG: hypothetical protein HY594_04715 [Candidatus Omnitrophica bacterium]|nr:hypothetical protein [Candidatus Omnitrophota bacterium]